MLMLPTESSNIMEVLILENKLIDATTAYNIDPASENYSTVKKLRYEIHKLLSSEAEKKLATCWQNKFILTIILW